MTGAAQKTELAHDVDAVVHIRVEAALGDAPLLGRTADHQPLNGAAAGNNINSGTVQFDTRQIVKDGANAERDSVNGAKRAAYYSSLSTGGSSRRIDPIVARLQNTRQHRVGLTRQLSLGNRVGTRSKSIHSEETDLPGRVQRLHSGMHLAPNTEYQVRQNGHKSWQRTRCAQQFAQLRVNMMRTEWTGTNSTRSMVSRAGKSAAMSSMNPP